MTTLPSSNSRTSDKPSWLDHLRLVWVLAAKDIIDALKSKTTLSVIILSFLMVLFYRYFPALTASDTLRVLVYAETESTVVTALERSPALASYSYDSREQLMNAFANTDVAELAIIIPETSVTQEQGSGPIMVDGYLMYWLNAAQRAEIKTVIEEELSYQLDRPVTLNLTVYDVYLNADVFFFDFSATIALLFVTIMIGISLIPNLMVEEKQAKTIDALLVSPASAVHLVAGKAIAGFFYGLLGCATVLFVFGYLVVQWNLAILAAMLSTLFMVAIGLLLGSVIKVRAQLQLVAWFIVIPLLIPVILVALEGLVPTGVVAVLNWIPTVLVAKIFRFSLTPNAVFAHYGVPLAVIIVFTLALFALLVGVVRRQSNV